MKHFATKYVCAHILDISSGFSLETSVSQHSNTQETKKCFSSEKTRPNGKEVHFGTTAGGLAQD